MGYGEWVGETIFTMQGYPTDQDLRYQGGQSDEEDGDSDDTTRTRALATMRMRMTMHLPHPTMKDLQKMAMPEEINRSTERTIG